VVRPHRPDPATGPAPIRPDPAPHRSAPLKKRIPFFLVLIQLPPTMSEQLTFKDRSAFRSWLKKNHARPGGIWLVFGKNNAVKTLTAEEALEEALCFGWIDGLIKRVDEARYVKFFSPRRAKSVWSEKNKKTAERLIRDRCMASPGRQVIERAKADGSWTRPQRPVVTTEDIESFGRLVAANRRAFINFQNMPPSSKKLFTGFYLDAKQNITRQRRLKKLIGLLEQNKRTMM
jgi:uncharacterized protein YdeI (YjbR/CyaY-like superfamily)